MLKRQDSCLSSSRRQVSGAASTPPTSEAHHAKGIGCMSGIIHLFSKYQNTSKRLTFGRKQEKLKPSSAIKAKRSSPREEKAEKQNFDAKRLICGVTAPRSPTLQPEIPQSSGSSSPEDSRTPSSLVARLMGLEDRGAAEDRPASEEDLVTEKRQRLLQALEKCNEDLEALKKIIKALQAADVRLRPPRPAMLGKSGLPAGGNVGSLEVMKPCVKKLTDVEAEERNIPVCTAAELTRSPISSLPIVQNASAGAGAIREIPPQRKPSAAKKPGEDDEPIAKLFDDKHPTTTEASSLLLMRRRAASPPPWSSRAMVQSVEEVSADIAWGEKREVGRIGLALQDHLFRELIQELVHELKKPCSVHHSLPLEACKRRLRF